MNRAFLHVLPLMLLVSPAFAATEQVEVSGPILPDVMVLYAAEGGAFPTTLAGEVSLASQAALTFPVLLNECAPLYPGITLTADGDPPLTPAQLNENYEQVAKCGYEVHTAKPYWIPKLVDDVDICENSLGADFHLLSESDLASFTEADFQFFADTLSGASNNMSGFGSFYFSLHVYVRGDDGTLKIGYLSPGVSPRVESLTVTGDALKSHYENNMSLRCIRRTILDPM